MADALFADSFGETSRRLVAARHDRQDTPMLRIERSANGEVCFTISGRIEAAYVAELQRLIDDETAGHRPVVLDLRDVKLVDRDAVTFLVRCEAIGVRLENCPAYVREWIGHDVDEPRGREVSRDRRPKTRKK